MASLTLLATIFWFLLSIAGAVDPTVQVGCNTYSGQANASGVTQWLGMRYAAPPIGNLRFMPPEDPPCSDEVQLAAKPGPFCLATGVTTLMSNMSEDCLYVNVFAPTKATPQSKLPVFFFIQGGGFNSNSNPNYDGTGLIKASGYNMLVVVLNYRVGPYGFITNGAEITPNNGLRDHWKALEWVSKYISAFGGDPDHVVLGGASAGAASISLHLTAYGGKDTGLFHAAAAESVSFATVLTIEESQYQYDQFAIQAGCAGNSSLACLRSKPAMELQHYGAAVPYPGAESAPLYMWNPVIDRDLVADLPYTSFAQGNFVKVPLLIGDDTNGGTVFTPRKTSTIGESGIFLKNTFPYLTLAQLGEINDLYPNQNLTCPNPGCYWRQVSDAYGDMRYMCPGLFIASEFANHAAPDVWNYRYNVEDPEDVAEGLGVTHVAEVNAIFGPQYTLGGAPTSYYMNGTNARVVAVIQGYWTSFVQTLDPNTKKHVTSAVWEKWTEESQQRLLFNTGGATEMETVGELTQSRCEYFKEIGVDIRQ